MLVALLDVGSAVGTSANQQVGQDVAEMGNGLSQ